MDAANLPVIPHAELNAAWLDQHHEDILEPNLPIVDPHHHLWDRGGGYFLDELLADTGSGHNSSRPCSSNVATVTVPPVRKSSARLVRLSSWPASRGTRSEESSRRARVPASSGPRI